jgi:hypothetical protein
VGLILKLMVLVLGIMAGINIATDKPILSNPFEDPAMQTKTLKATGEFIEDVTERLGLEEKAKQFKEEALKENQEQIREQVQDALDKIPDAGN